MKNIWLMLTLIVILSLNYSFAVQYGSFTDKRDGKKYKTVKIGKTVWMAENLNWRPNTFGVVCYERDRHNCKKYGALYDFERSQQACPAGWRLPTKEDANEMLLVLNQKRHKNENRVTAIRDVETWNPVDDDHFEYDAKSKQFYATDYEEPRYGTNRIGFSALAAGWLIVKDEDSYEGMGQMTGFWLDEEDNYILFNGHKIRRPSFDNSIHVGLSFYDVLLGPALYEKYYLSIRCVRK